LGVAGWEFDQAAQSVISHASSGPTDMGGPGIAHGGWTAAVFDDVLGRLGLGLGELAVTASLSVQYLKPVPIEQDLIVQGRVVSRRGTRRMVTGELRVAGADEVLATAEAVLVAVSARHGQRHRDLGTDAVIGPASVAEPSGDSGATR
jgi:acyl-coenzyme A thioesterase PaaI-like protein